MYGGEISSRFSRQMGYTQREFLANLDAALRGRSYTCHDGKIIHIPVDDGRVVIRLGPEQQRRIASLAMPFMEVEFVFENLDADKRRRFYSAFQRSFQKGGG